MLETIRLIDDGKGKAGEDSLPDANQHVQISKGALGAELLDFSLPRKVRGNGLYGAPGE